MGRALLVLLGVPAWGLFLAVGTEPLEGREEKRMGRRGEDGVGAQGLLPGKQAPSLWLHPPEGREFDLRGWETRNLLVCWGPCWQGQFRSDQNEVCGSGSLGIQEVLGQN